MITYAFRTLIIPAATQVMAQTMCEQLAEGDAGKGMFIRALQPVGGTEATHYISSGAIDEQFANLLPLTVVQTSYEGDEPVETTTVTPGDAATVYALAQQVGLPVTIEQIAGLLSLVDSSEQSPEAAMARLGLEFVPDKYEVLT